MRSDTDIVYLNRTYQHHSIQAILGNTRSGFHRSRFCYHIVFLYQSMLMKSDVGSLIRLLQIYCTNQADNDVPTVN